MSPKLTNYLITTGCYALLLGVAALLQPDPRWSITTANGFHVSVFGSLVTGALMALLLAGFRTWFASRISGTGFHWPTLAGGLLSVFVVLLVANGLLSWNTFYIRGPIGWVVTPVLVWLGTVAFDKFGGALTGHTQRAASSISGHVSAMRQNVPPSA